MSLLGDARRLGKEGPPSIYDTAFCGRCGARRTGDAADGHAPDCPWLAMPKIVAALETYERCLDSMARVWNKTRAAYQEGHDAWATYKEYVEMGDSLYHATDGERGACGRYDGPPCTKEP